MPYFVPKTLNSSYGRVQIDVPQDRQSTFAPQVVKKQELVYNFCYFIGGS